MSEIEKKAVRLAEQGFRVFPLHGVWDGCCTCGDPKCSSPGKHPRGSGWQGKASLDSGIVSKAFRHFQTANIGILTGSGLLVVDVDGADGERSLAHLEGKNGSLPPTRESNTGRGRHLLFKCPADHEIKNRVAIAQGLDTRGDGGYIVGPGSIHANGTQYHWKDECAAIADAPGWLLDVLAAKNISDVATGEVIREGERNSRIYKFACESFRTGLTREAVLEKALAVNVQQCIPPLSEEAIYDLVSRVAESNDPGLATRDNIPLRWFKYDATEVLTDMRIDVLSDVQLGWRSRLVAYAWLNRGRLPNNVEDLARMARASSKARFRSDYKKALFDFVPFEAGGESYLFNEELAKEHAECSSIWRKRQAAGQASAEKRARERAKATQEQDVQSEEGVAA